MSSYTFSQKTFKPTPPQKGSFPLDHEGYCKSVMIKYMRCLNDHRNNGLHLFSDAVDHLGRFLASPRIRGL
ncbi:hypothetical protein KM043_013220 [Ampulex compressa]|nr:hypothetical protein KM043_013220 [Ampulex compressa]